MTTYDDRPKTAADVRMEPATINADDGRELAVTWFEPDPQAHPEPRGAVVVVGAMATSRRFYAPFGRWLAERGFLALTVDYRGTESRAALRAERGDLVRWTGDAASALEALVERAGPDVPVTWVGHSLGGQCLPFARHDLLERAVLVSAGSGYWRLNHPSIRRRAPFFWWVLVPAATRVAGYYPGRRLGVLGDVPTGVMAQWGRWCRRPEYAAADVPSFSDRLAEVEVPITSISFTDDELLSARSMTALEGWYANAPVTRIRTSPGDLGVERVGHHGLFRSTHHGDWDTLVLPHLAVRDASD